MKRQTLALIILTLFITASVSAQTYVSGAISGVWAAAGSPYIIAGNCSVPESDTLLVEAGIVIEFSGDWEFTIGGVCIFEGISSAPISITVSSGGSFLIDSGSAFWQYTIFESGSYEIEVIDGELSISYSEFSVSGSSDAAFFITCSGGDVDLLSCDYWSDSAGLISASDADVVISDCSINYHKDDWYDGSFLIYSAGNEAVISDNVISMNVNAGDAFSTGVLIKLESECDAEITGNTISGTIELDDDNDEGAIIGINGGLGSISDNTIEIHPDIPIGTDEAELEIAGVQYFSGEIDNNVALITTGSTVNLNSSANGISSSTGSIHHNLIVVSGEVWSFCLNSCDGEIINNTIRIEGVDPLEESHFGVAYCNGILKNNIIEGVGSAVHTYWNTTHTYNCYWGSAGDFVIPPLGTGEVNADPLLNASFQLTSTSPCINSGDPASPLDPDSTWADMGAFYIDQSDRPVITDYSPQGFTSAPEHTSQEFWITAIDPAGTGLNYLWIYRNEIVSADSLTTILFSDAREDSITAMVFNSVGSDSQKWYFDLTNVDVNIHVPNDFTTIQEAIDYASFSGDTILVSEGIYYENLEMIDKSVSIIGAVPAGSAIIDGGSQGSALAIENCGSQTVLLYNLTFQNGYSANGGGICAIGAAIDMKNCRIADNQADSSGNAYGGGCYLKAGGLVIDSTVIENNTLRADGYARGGGLYCDGLLEMRNSTIINNTISEGLVMATGAGIHYSGGGGLIENCVIRGNSLGSGEFLFGAGIRCSNAELWHVEIVDNAILDGINSRGGGLYAVYSVIEKCTIANNEAEDGSGIFVQVSGQTTIHNSIVALNSGSPQIASELDNIADISYSDVFSTSGLPYGNCVPGEGCLSVDPQFVGGTPLDVHLNEGSPCIDAGDPVSPPDPDATRADMGCYYFDALSLLDKEGAKLPTEYFISPPYPNPFNPVTAISYQLSALSYVSLTVYDIQGREVAELVNCWRDAGVHEVTFDGSNLASGVYIYRMTAGSFEASGKMVLLK